MLEAIGETHIRFDGGGFIGRRFEKSSRIKAGKIECKDDVWLWSPPNLEISLVAEIAGMAGTGGINQGSISKSVYPVVR